MGRSAFPDTGGSMRLVLGVSRRIAAMVALSVSLVVVTLEVPAARSQAAQIATIAPASDAPETA